MSQENSVGNTEPSEEELRKAAGAESYQAEPVDDAELGRVWQAPSAQGSHSPTADDDGGPDVAQVSEDPA